MLRKIDLDVSCLEAPLPLVKAIEAIEALKENEFIHFKHRMHPCKLEEVIKNNNLQFFTKEDEFHHFYIFKPNKEITCIADLV